MKELLRLKKFLEQYPYCSKLPVADGGTYHPVELQDDGKSVPAGDGSSLLFCDVNPDGRGFTELLSGLRDARSSREQLAVIDSFLKNGEAVKKDLQTSPVGGGQTEYGI